MFMMGIILGVLEFALNFDKIWVSWDATLNKSSWIFWVVLKRTDIK